MSGRRSRERGKPEGGASVSNGFSYWMPEGLMSWTDRAATSSSTGGERTKPDERCGRGQAKQEASARWEKRRNEEDERDERRTRSASASRQLLLA